MTGILLRGYLLHNLRRAGFVVFLVLSLLLSACTAPNQPTRRPATCKLANLPTCTRPLIITPATTPWPFDRLRTGPRRPPGPFG